MSECNYGQREKNLDKIQFLRQAVELIRQGQPEVKQQGVALGRPACFICEHFDKCRIKNDDGIWERLEGPLSSSIFLANLEVMEEKTEQTGIDVMCGKLLTRNYFEK
jgi:hypothetical protein